MSLLDQIAHAMEARRKEEREAEARQTLSGRSIANAQFAALVRWEGEIFPLIVATIDKLNRALGGKLTGDYLETFNEVHTRVTRGHMRLGEQMSITARLVQGVMPPSFIKIGLEVRYGPQAAILFVTHNGKRILHIVVDDALHCDDIEICLTRIVYNAVMQEP
jgi:hypothetical protein